MLNIEKTRVKIGLEKPLKVLHITDSHLPLCEEGDDPRMAEWLIWICEDKEISKHGKSGNTCIV